MSNKIIKVGVYSEYFLPQDIWASTVWAQSYDDTRFHLKEWSPTFESAQTAAKNLLGTELDSNWEEV